MVNSNAGNVVKEEDRDMDVRGGVAVENSGHMTVDSDDKDPVGGSIQKKKILGFDDYAYVERAAFLNNDKTILFASSRSNGETLWITGKAYSDIYEKQNGEIPSVKHMDSVRSIVMNEDGNYFPKATLAYNCRVPANIPKDQQWQMQRRIAMLTLQDNGLSGETWSGMVKQPSGTYELPLNKRLLETETGSRRQQRQFKYEKHAGVENENLLVIKPDGTVFSFDIKPDDVRAKLPINELEQTLGGRIHLKSERSNGYHSVSYLDKRDGVDGAQKRYNSQLGLEVNTNQNLPAVGILLNGTLFDARAVIRNKDANPALAEALVNGQKEIAHLVRLRTRTGGYWTPDYMKNNDVSQFRGLMNSYGISSKIGEHRYTSGERRKHRMEVPKALIDTGKPYLESDQSVRDQLLPKQTIASKYGQDKILVTNADKDGHPTGFYRQIGAAANELEKVHPLSLRGIHTTKDGSYMPELAAMRVPELGESKPHVDIKPSRDETYVARSRERQAGARYF